MWRVLLALLVVFAIIVGCVPITEKDWTVQFDSGTAEVAKIAYIPLDNRPVNTVRAVYLAQSAGFELLMPDEDLYRTALDGQPLNSNGTKHGNWTQLLSWLENVEADYYVISIDQILSGGLVNSRCMLEITDEQQRIDRLLTAVEGKSTVLFDTVMRLAPTVGYMGCTMSEYQALREYGVTSRPMLSGIITEEAIISAYETEASLNSAMVDAYLEARTRKLWLSSYLLDKLNDKEQIHLFYGIDDSSSGNTIQTNEIAFIKQRLTNGEIFAGTDELGMMAITRIIQKHYSGSNESRVSIQYFGADPDRPADDYDVATLRQALSSHIKSIGLDISDAEYDIEVLVLGDCDQAGHRISMEKLINRYKQNNLNRTPTIIIDLSAQPQMVAAMLTEEGVQLGCLLGYSSWNTAGNAIGIALSNGVARYYYLKYVQEPVAGANSAFIKGLYFSFAKDVCYDAAKPYIDEYIFACGGDIYNFYASDISEHDLEKITLKHVNRNDWVGFEDFSAMLENTVFLSDLFPYSTAPVPAAHIAGIHFPWWRTFEAEIELQLG